MGEFKLVVNGPILKNNLGFWSHWLIGQSLHISYANGQAKKRTCNKLLGFVLAKNGLSFLFQQMRAGGSHISTNESTNLKLLNRTAAAV